MMINDKTQPPHSWFNPYGQEGPHKDGDSLLDGLEMPLGPEPKNVMETLVMMEVIQQVQQLSQKQQAFIQVSQIKAYALNHLPPMYVTSEKGWERQWERGQNELQETIMIAVRQGIAAVQRDPLREITQLSSESSPLAETALRQIMRLLGREDLTWYTVIPALKKALGVKGHLPGRPPETQVSKALDRVGNSASSTNWDENHRL